MGEGGEFRQGQNISFVSASRHTIFISKATAKRMAVSRTFVLVKTETKIVLSIFGKETLFLTKSHN